MSRNPLALPLVLVSTLALVELAIIAVLLFRGEGPTPVSVVTFPPITASTSSSPVSTTATATAAGPPHGKIGQRVESAGLGITVEKLLHEPLTYKEQVTVRSHQRYLALLVLVENNTGGNAQVFPSQFGLKDEKGFTYDQLGVHGTMPVLEWRTLGNRENVRGYVDFVVPTSAKGLSLVYSDVSRDGAQPIRVDLGP